MNTQGEASCPTICPFPSWRVIFVHCALLGHCMASIFGARNSDRDAACRAVWILCFPANLSLSPDISILSIFWIQGSWWVEIVNIKYSFAGREVCNEFVMTNIMLMFAEILAECCEMLQLNPANCSLGRKELISSSTKTTDCHSLQHRIQF